MRRRRPATALALGAALLFAGCEAARPGREDASRPAADTRPGGGAPRPGPPRREPPPPLPLRPAASPPAERELPPGGGQSFSLDLRAGQYAHVVLQQLGVDLVATVRDPADQLLLRVDSPNGDRGTEEVFLVAERSGPHLLEIETWEAAKGGRYAVQLEALRLASDDDRRRAAAAGAFSRGRRLELAGGEGVAAAAAAYREAARLWENLEDDGRQASALERLGLLDPEDRARGGEGIAALSRAAELFGRAGEERRQALALGHLGRARWQAGQVEAAGSAFEQALALWLRLGDAIEQAARLDDLAAVRMRQRRVRAAIELYSRAIAIWHGQGSRDSLATTRTNLGLLYASLGELRLALDQYRRALALLDGQPDPRQRAVTLNKLGDVLLWLDGPEAALRHYRQALALRDEAHDTRGRAVTLTSIGLAQVEAQRPREALEALVAAAETFHERGEARAEAVVLNHLGRTRERLGQTGEAREHFEAALALARAGGSRQTEAGSLFGLARVARSEGRLEEAHEQIERTLEALERIRSDAWRPDLRLAFQAASQQQHEFLVDLLVERDAREPGRGHGEEAFTASERARARGLLDFLSTPRAPLDPRELRHLDELARRINSRHLESLRARAEKPAGVADEEAPTELAGLFSDLRQAEAVARGGQPQPERPSLTLSLAEVQRRVLDDETLLLEYFLGERRSFLWAVTSTDVRLVTLPGRSEIEEAAARARSLMIESHHETAEVAARQAAARLSRLVLAPVADLLLERRRLAVVAPGALQAVPFAALPQPRPEGWTTDWEERPLVADHPLASLPSASVLAALRRRIDGRPPATGLLALVADPVLEASDERLADRRSGPPAPPPVRPGERRLPFARQEAEAILALAGDRPVLTALGLDASRDLLASGRLRAFRIVHFATHGSVNDLHPELSSIVLSAFDRDGRPVDGLLRAYELFHLELRADLVVLSACGTALGEEVRGEGLVGLTQGLFDAGAARVLASLWDVSDHATAELMRRFYAALWNEGLAPAEALQRAQLSLAADPRWRAPYFWAGFVLQGEWR